MTKLPNFPNFQRGGKGWGLICFLIVGIGAVGGAARGQATTLQTPGAVTLPPVQCQLEVTSIEATKPLGASGGLIVTRAEGEAAVSDLTNKSSEKYDFPVRAALNVFKQHLSNGLDLTIHLNLDEPASGESSHLVAKLEWMNANGQHVDYAIEYKAQLHADDVYMITAPWAGKRDADIFFALSK